MRTTVVIMSFVALVLVAPGPVHATTAEASPKFYERTILTDPAGDGTLLPAADLTALFAHERWEAIRPSFGAPDKVLILRVQPAQLQMTPHVDIRYAIHVTLNGDRQVIQAVVSEAGVGPWASSQAPGVDAYVSNGSVVFRIPFGVLGASVGDTLEDVWVGTSIQNLPDGSPAYHDVMPHNGSAGDPAVSPDPERIGAIELESPFPFVTLELLGPAAEEAYGPTAVAFRFRIDVAHPSWTDRMYVRANLPDGWASEASHYSTFIWPDAPHPDFVLRVTPPEKARPGDEESITVIMWSREGAFQSHDLKVTVVEPRVSSGAYRFDRDFPQVVAPGDDIDLRVRVLTAAGEPLADADRVRFELRRGADVVDRPLPERQANGWYNATVTFDRTGHWTIDAYISNIRPSPHAEFRVAVGVAALVDSPILTVSAVLAALGAAVALRRKVSV